jgi:glucans biosynthesis protein
VSIRKCADLVLVLAIASATAAPSRAQLSPAQFSIEDVRRTARELSAKKYVQRSAQDLPAWLAKLDFDSYRRIQFRPPATLWRGDSLHFEMQFAHRGYLFPYRLPVHLIEGGAIVDARFSPAQFQYEAPGELPEDLGYAGFRVLLPVDGLGRQHSEVASFLGASYFRVLGEGQRFGASARGLAIDTASPNGEEFPEFVEVWVQRPAPAARELEIDALLDSPSTTGAFRFVLTPGVQTTVDVSAWLYPRREIAKLGLAPLTTMFLYGEERLRCLPDFRPEVHDSDGVLIEGNDGDWLWRPLENPEGEHLVTRLALADPRGFGLLQRDRSFDDYQDLESRFEQRVSYWVTPQDSWGDGALELVEIPSEGERNDNVSLYWVPARAPAAKDEFAFRYRLSAFLDEPSRPPLARTRSTRIRPSEGSTLFVLDFAGPELEKDLATLRADVTARPGEIRNLVLQPNEAAGGMRCAFELVGAGNQPVELRAWLRRGDQRVSETWVYPWKKR